MSESSTLRTIPHCPLPTHLPSSSVPSRTCGDLSSFFLISPGGLVAASFAMMFRNFVVSRPLSRRCEPAHLLCPRRQFLVASSHFQPDPIMYSPISGLLLQQAEWEAGLIDVYGGRWCLARRFFAWPRICSFAYLSFSNCTSANSELARFGTFMFCARALNYARYFAG